MNILIKNKIKKQIIKDIETNGGTDHGFMSRITNYSGDQDMVDTVHNVVFFSGISEEATEALSEIMKEGKYKFYRASNLDVISYPTIPNIPMAYKANHKYKELRFYP